MREFTWELFERLGEEYELVIDAMEIAEDRVHLVVEIPPRRSVAEAVRIFKSLSAREIVEKFPGVKKRLWAGELWKDGYFVRSVGTDVTWEIVKRYVETHKEREGSPGQLRLALGEPQRAPDSPGLVPG